MTRQTTALLYTLTARFTFLRGVLRVNICKKKVAEHNAVGKEEQAMPS